MLAVRLAAHLLHKYLRETRLGFWGQEQQPPLVERRLLLPEHTASGPLQGLPLAEMEPWQLPQLVRRQYHVAHGLGSASDACQRRREGQRVRAERQVRHPQRVTVAWVGATRATPCGCLQQLPPVHAATGLTPRVVKGACLGRQ
ncbi:hypothetical protein [Mumia zhuanghuii]|uniref:Uncharacterized protein n=1 Tax=Mumia zhuanghuii TaxID=2585211 RepID=A0A5C4MEV3_9ACTN|nr:hypothetical protein [Mumia zhuanghuii]TNC41849.1 hypothetical protein FHE65_21715 [Mumia zhuanghuii]